MVDEVCMSTSLLDGAKEVFETMIFMDLEESSEPDHNIESESLLSSITFKGDIEGCLSICCNMSCANVIAANMLGLDDDEEVGNGDVCDAMGEVANMVLGSVKARIQESVGSIEVSIPVVISGRHLENSLGERASRVLLKVNIEDTHPAEFSLLYKEKVPE